MHLKRYKVSQTDDKRSFVIGKRGLVRRERAARSVFSMQSPEKTDLTLFSPFGENSARLCRQSEIQSIFLNLPPFGGSRRVRGANAVNTNRLAACRKGKLRLPIKRIVYVLLRIGITCRDHQSNSGVEHDIKSAAEELFGSFGLTVTDTVNVFLRQFLMRGGFPYEIVRYKPNTITQAAIAEY